MLLKNILNWEKKVIQPYILFNFLCSVIVISSSSCIKEKIKNVYI